MMPKSPEANLRSRNAVGHVQKMNLKKLSVSERANLAS